MNVAWAGKKHKELVRYYFSAYVSFLAVSRLAGQLAGLQRA